MQWTSYKNLQEASLANTYMFSEENKSTEAVIPTNLLMNMLFYL